MASVGTLLRLMRAGFVLARHDAILPREYQEKLPFLVRLFGHIARLGVLPSSDGPGVRLARALEQLGPSYVKLGQFLATRGDILSKEVVDGLAALKDQMPPFSMSAAKAALYDAFGEEADTLFASLEPPLSAASIAQVHRATDASGKALAVKILRPGIEARIKKDIAAMALGARLAERFFTRSKRLEPVKFVETLARSLTLELDLRLEAAAASELGELVDAKDILVPEVDWSRTSLRVFTMSWLDGIALSDKTALAKSDIDKAALARILTAGFLKSALDEGVFHADMHEGNLFAMPDGRLGLVDFGIVGRIGPAERRYLAEILYGFLRRDYRRVAEVHFEAGYVPDAYSVDDFAQALRAVGEPIFGKTASDVSMSRLLLQLFDVTAQFDMHLRPELVLLQKTMVQVEGVARGLDPNHDLWGVANPVVENWIRRELGPQGLMNQAVDALYDLHRVLPKLPALAQDMAAIAARINENGLTLDTGSIEKLATARAHKTRWARRALYALALAALAMAVKLWI